MYKRKCLDRGQRKGNVVQHITSGNKLSSESINRSPDYLGSKTAYPTPKNISITCNSGPEEFDISQFRDCYEVYGENCPICRRWVR